MAVPSAPPLTPKFEQDLSKFQTDIPIMNQQPTTLYSRRPTEINDQEIEEEEVVEVVVKEEPIIVLDIVLKSVVLLDLIKLIF